MKVAGRLAAKGCAVWCPTTTEKRRWSDRWKAVTVPLFPGYLFASTRGSGYVPLLRTPGVLTLVKEGLHPAVVDEGFINRLRGALDNPLVEAEPAPLEFAYHPGAEVLVRDGPLAGLRGIVTELRGTRRLLVRVHHVGRGLLCTLGTAAVIPADGAL